MPTILIVDDEPSIRLTLSEFLKEDGHDVLVAQDAIVALSLMNNVSIDVVVTDVIMPKMSGIELLEEIRRKFENIPAIVITGEPNVNSAAKAVRAGAFDYMSKPISGRDVCKVVAAAAKVKRLSDQNRALAHSQQCCKILLAHSSDAVFFYPVHNNIPGKFTEVSEATCKLLGYSRKELLNMTFSDLSEPDSTGEIRHRNGTPIKAEISNYLFEMHAVDMIFSIIRLP